MLLTKNVSFMTFEAILIADSISCMASSLMHDKYPLTFRGQEVGLSCPIIGCISDIVYAEYPSRVAIYSIE